MVKRVKKTKGAANTAPSGTGKVTMRKRAVKVSVATSDNDDPSSGFAGPLAETIKKITDSGKYGAPFVRASSKALDFGYVRTGILAVDLCLGGGWKKTRAGMLYGERSSGKSTMALQSIAELHRVDKDAIAVWVDVEGTFDRAWSRKLGVDNDRLLIVVPETGEHAVDLSDAMLRTPGVSIVVVDSIAMLVPMREIEDSAEQETMALQARLVGKYIRKTNNALLNQKLAGRNPVLLHINQFRMKVGLVFGDPRTLPGGKALEFSTTQQIEIKNKEKRGKDEFGNDIVEYNEHNAKITKNKGGGPMREAAYKMIRHANSGMPEGWIDQAKTIYKYGTQAGIIVGSPSSFEVDELGKFRGAPSFNNWAIENPVDYSRLQDKIIVAFRKKWELE